MGIIISVCAFLLKTLRFGLARLLTIPGMIITAFAGLGVAIAILGQDVFGCCSQLVSLLDHAKDYLDQFAAWLKSNYYFPQFSYMFALDTLASSLAAFLGLVLVALGLSAFQIVFQCLVVAVPFLIYKTTAKMLKVATAGKVEG